jgi:hypothetical protein
MMAPETLLAPMGALAALTFLVLILIPIARFRAAFAGKVTAKDFELGESQRVPARVSLPNRNLMNLLEMPVLFYVLCLICLVTHRIDSVIVTAAWTYVGLRVLHSLVHITYNNVFHRLTVYATSNVLLSLMWVWMFWTIYGLPSST